MCKKIVRSFDQQQQQQVPILNSRGMGIVALPIYLGESEVTVAAGGVICELVVLHCYLSSFV